MVSPTPQPTLQQSQGIIRDLSKPQTYSVHRIAPRLSSAPFQTGSSRVINVTLLGPGRGLPRQTPQHYAGPLESPVFLPIGLVRVNLHWISVSEKARAQPLWRASWLTSIATSIRPIPFLKVIFKWTNYRAACGGAFSHDRHLATVAAVSEQLHAAWQIPARGHR